MLAFVSACLPTCLHSTYRLVQPPVRPLPISATQLIRDIVDIFRQHQISTHVLSASIRHPYHALESAKAGAYAGTMPFKVLKQMAEHVMTDKGLAAFCEDWAKAANSQKNAL